MLIQRSPRKALLAVILMLMPQVCLPQLQFDSQTFSDYGSLTEAGTIELLSVGGQSVNGDSSSASEGLQLGYLYTLDLVTKPLAAIDSPAGKGLCSIVNGNVTVMGSVESANLSEYQLEAAPGFNAAAGFILLSSGTTAVSGALASWPTSGLAGFHTLRLRAVDASGGTMTSRVTVFVGQPSAALTIAGLDKPEGAAAGPNESIYAADTHNNRISIYTSTGAVISHFGDFHKPYGVAVDGIGNIYAADTQNDRVLKLGADGGVLMTYGDSDKKNSSFKKPQGTAVGADGLVYVADTGNQSIKVFAADGAAALSFPLPDGGTPVSVTIDQSGRIFAADVKGSRILRFDAAGQLQKVYGAGLLKRPGGVAIGADQECLMVADSGNDRIVRFDQFGNLQAAFTGLGSPAGLSFTPSGELLVAERSNDRILKLKHPGFTPSSSARRRRGHGRAQAKLYRSRDGKVERDDGTGVRVPSGAMAADLEITVDSADATSDAESKQAKRRRRKVHAASEEIEYGPEGTIFNKPVTLVLAYDPEEIAAQGIRENELKVFYWNKLLSDWEAMPSFVDKDNKTVSALTTHFSGYQVQGPSAGIGVAAAIDEFYFREAYAFPNPVRGASAVTLRIQPGLADAVEVRIYDLAGRKIHSSSDFRFSVTGGEDTYDHAWNVSGIGSGVYAFVIRARKAGQTDIVRAGKIGVIK